MREWRRVRKGEARPVSRNPCTGEGGLEGTARKSFPIAGGHILMGFPLAMNGQYSTRAAFG